MTMITAVHRYTNLFTPSDFGVIGERLMEKLSSSRAQERKQAFRTLAGMLHAGLIPHTHLIEAMGLGCEHNGKLRLVVQLAAPVQEEATSE